MGTGQPLKGRTEMMFVTGRRDHCERSKQELEKKKKLTEDDTDKETEPFKEAIRDRH